MPIIVDFEYEDGTKERITYPAQVWRKNDNEVKKLITSNKKIININLDPDLETADIDTYQIIHGLKNKMNQILINLNLK